MKRFTFLTTAVTAVILITGAGSCKSKRQPGSIYMPDMTYSRAMETYAELDSTKFTANAGALGKEIFYNRKPVDGTIARGDIGAYTLPNDSVGYALSAQVKNPLPPLAGNDSAEASRLYNINCGICHGAEGKANGPLTAKLGGVVNLTGDQYVKMADGTIYHSIYYGKNNMGSYASQLGRKQRWMVVQYVRTLQPKAQAGAATATAAKDSSSVKKG